MHGVSAKKLKHILETYEHDITAESLFAMLPPLVGGNRSTQSIAVSAPIPVQTTTVSILDYAVKSQSVVVGSLCHATSLLSAADSIVDSSPESSLVSSLPSGCSVSSNAGTNDCTSSANSIPLLSPSQSTNNVPKSLCHSCPFENTSQGESAVTKDSLAEATENVDTAITSQIVVPSLSCTRTLSFSGNSSCKLISSISDPVASAFSPSELAATDSICAGENCSDSSVMAGVPVITSDAGIVQSSRKLSDSKLVSDTSPADSDTVSMVAKRDQSATSVDNFQQHLLTNYMDVFSSVKSSSTDLDTLESQLYTAVSMHADTVHLSVVPPDTNSDHFRPASQSLDLSDVNSSDTFVKFGLCDNTEKVDGKREQENEAYNTHHYSSDDHRIEMLGKCQKITEQLLSEIRMAEVEGSISTQLNNHCLESDQLGVGEAPMKDLETRCCSEPKAVELLYWGQTDISDRVHNEHGEVPALSESSDDVLSDPKMVDSREHFSGMMEPKPQRTKPRGSQNKLMESILAGREWVTECARGWISDTEPSNSCSPDDAPFYTSTDRCSTDCLFISNECQSNSTQTEPCDFIMLTKVVNSDVVDMAEYVAIVDGTPRVISSEVTVEQTSTKVPFRSLLDKSCSTDHEIETMESSSQLDFLASCFPTISSRELQVLLTNCGNDVTVAADLLLEFGYEYNEVHDDVEDACSLSSSDTDFLSYSSDRPAKRESCSAPSTKETRRRSNTLPLYRLGRDLLISKGIVPGSRNAQPRHELQLPISIPTSGVSLHWSCKFLPSCFSLHRCFLS